MTPSTGAIVGYIQLALLFPFAVAADADPLLAPDKPLWNAPRAAHLLRRAGFGGSPEQVRRLQSLGRDGAVDALLEYEKIPQDDPDYPAENMPDRPPRRHFAGLNESERKQLIQVFQRLGSAYQTSLQDWWLRRMVVTPRPMEEKMTLFWHGLLTSGFREVREPRSMYRQNAFLRKHALGDFKTILRGISRDRAMLTYLDGSKNVKAHPNENYARELMELFSLGIGHYTEDDIKQAARAFTGWTTDEDGHFYVRRREHDEGEKTFLGKTGNFDGDDIIDIILEQPAASEYLARRLVTFFAEPSPPQPVVDALAARLRASRYDVRDAMKALLRSEYFYSPRVHLAQIKSPAELLVGTARALESPVGDLRQANRQMAQMGQELFQPPNVKGWDGGRAWINTSTLFIRYNTMTGLVNGTRGRPDRDRGMERLAARLAEVGIGSQTAPAVKVADLAGERLAKSDEEEPSMMAPEEQEKLNGLAAIVAKLPQPAQEWLKTVQLPPQYSDAQPMYDPTPVLTKYKLRDAGDVVDHYVQRLLATKLEESRRAVLIQALQAEGGRFNVKDPSTPARVRAMIHLITSMPEYQLN